jgi:hypothetical protein
MNTAAACHRPIARKRIATGQHIRKVRVLLLIIITCESTGADVIRI